MGSPITVPRAGIVKIIIMGYTNSYTASWRLSLTRGGVLNIVQDQSGNVSWSSTTDTSNVFITHNGLNAYFVIELLCLANDVIQLEGANNTAGTTIYISDMVVILQ